MSEIAQVMQVISDMRGEQREQRVILDNLKESGTEVKSDLKALTEESRGEFKKLSDNARADFARLDERMQKVEHKSTLIRGIWLAVVGFSTLVGIVGVVVAIVANASRLVGH